MARVGLRRLPIRIRLTIAFTAVIAAVLGAGGLVLATEFARDFDAILDEQLEARLVDASAVLAESSNPQQALASGAEPLSQVYGPDGRLLATTTRAARSRLLSATEVRRAVERELVVARRSTPRGDVRVSAGPARTVDSPALALAVAEPLAARDAALARLRALLLIAGPLALLLAVYAGYQVASAALRPVARMRDRAERITEHDVAERLPVPETRDEIAALGQTLNALLERLDSALARERRLLADASHELRTPLTILRAEIQLALRQERSARELRQALASAEEQTKRLSRLANDLLVLARADQGRLPLRPEPLIAREVLASAARRSMGAAEAAARSIVIDPDSTLDSVLIADPDRTAQALDNLIANALAHGDGEVTLSVRDHDRRVELHVADRGPGLSRDLEGRAFERFSRGDRARSGAGTGLGLAIVAAIAHAHAGSAGARNRPDGGADVWISLPAASAHSALSR